MLRVFLFAALAASAVSQPVPLPRSYPGFRWGAPGTAPVSIEGFLDLLCPDCSGAWPTVTSMLNHYGPVNVSFVFHVFPLPYHTLAFTVAQGAQVVKALNGSDAAVYSYITLMFANQGSFSSQTLSVAQAIDALATLVAANLPYTKAAFTAGMADDDLNEQARIAWKYGCSRYTTGTPHFLVNGLPVDDQLGAGGLADWIALIDPLMAPAAPSSEL